MTAIGGPAAVADGTADKVRQLRKKSAGVAVAMARVFRPTPILRPRSPDGCGSDAAVGTIVVAMAQDSLLFRERGAANGKMVFPPAG